MPSLSREQINQYEEDGYITPINVFSKDGVRVCFIGVNVDL